MLDKQTIDRLREVAQWATKGTWKQDRYGVNVLSDIPEGTEGVSPYRTGEEYVAHTRIMSDAKYIATFQPSTVLSLLDAAEAYLKLETIKSL